MVVLGLALGLEGAGRMFKTSSRLSERQYAYNAYKWAFVLKGFDFMLLLLIYVLQVVYLTGVTELHVINVKFRVHIAGNSLGSFWESRKKILNVWFFH